jgi:hypothetical protein
MNKERLIRFAKQYYNDISHPLAVANYFPIMTKEWIVGLFHDILEENLDKKRIEFELLDVLDHNFELFRAIQFLTRYPVVYYSDYIRRIKLAKVHNAIGGKLAWKVKIADLKHNLSRTETLKPSLKKRYESALKILLK